MSRFPKYLRTILECVIVVIIGGVATTLIDRIPTEPKVKNVI